MADGELGAGGQRLDHVVGEVPRAVLAAAAGPVAAKVHGDDVVAAVGEGGPDPAPGPVVGHHAVDQEGETVALAPGLGVQLHGGALLGGVR
ncbi:hypothetical protein L8C58_03350 [Streptomyces sp. CMAA1738]|nr:hypothetical protein [Streptomyces sp. CMAA1738]MEC4570146.1 hypothetical protein [Streptomyces sp. CMAA1738]